MLLEPRHSRPAAAMYCKSVRRLGTNSKLTRYITKIMMYQVQVQAPVMQKVGDKVIEIKLVEFLAVTSSCHIHPKKKRIIISSDSMITDIQLGLSILH